MYETRLQKYEEEIAALTEAVGQREQEIEDRESERLQWQFQVKAAEESQRSHAEERRRLEDRLSAANDALADREDRLRRADADCERTRRDLEDKAQEIRV